MVALTFPRGLKLSPFWSAPAVPASRVPSALDSKAEGWCRAQAISSLLGYGTSVEALS
jgi:hypothetical protein